MRKGWGEGGARQFEVPVMCHDSLPPCFHELSTFVELDNKFYAFGGWSHHNWCEPLNSTEVYDPTTDTWT